MSAPVLYRHDGRDVDVDGVAATVAKARPWANSSRACRPSSPAPPAPARDLGPDNTRVNAICPRFIDTDITAGLLKPDKLQAIIASVPMGRPGHAHEVAGCALFLACDQQSSYVTGGEIDINDGSHIQ